MKPREKTLDEIKQQHKRFVTYVQKNPERVAYILSVIKYIHEQHVKEAEK